MASPRPARLVVAATLSVAALASAEPSAKGACAELPNAALADLGLHVVNAGYQRTATCHLVLQASAGLYLPWTVNGNVLGLGGGDRPPPGVWDVAGFVVRARPFVFPLGKAPVGPWVSPFAQAGYVRGERGASTLDGIAFAQGLSVGWTLRPLPRWLLALGAGAQLQVASFGGSTVAPGFARLGPQIDLNVGYRF